MVKFKDLNNGEMNSGKPGPSRNSQAQRTDSRLSFRKLAAEQQKAPETEKVVVEKKASGKAPINESGEVLYKKAASYLKQVFEAVKQRKMFSLEPGLQIIQEMVEIQSFQNALFIEALHLDDTLQFIIQNNINVAIYAIRMAENLGFSKDRQIEIGMAGLLHDIGMALIPEKLIYKQQKLSEAEFKIFKERSNYSYKILKSLGDDYAYLAECAAQVNERLDGSGYPQGLQGNEINEYAQIIGLVDMYEAMIHSRPQRVKFLHFTAVKEIIKSGKNLFQREHLKALLNIFSIFPLSSYVRLNTNAVGKVIETYPDLPMRPKIQIVFDSQQRRVLTERIVNLPDDPLIYIVDSVSDEELQQLSEGASNGTRAHTDREKKHDGSDAAETDVTDVDDELPPGIQAAEDQPDPEPKTDRSKTILIFVAITLLAAGLIAQYVNNNSKPVDADQTPIAELGKIKESTFTTESKAVVSPAVKQRQAPDNIDKEKPIVSQTPDLKDHESSSGATPDQTLLASSLQAEAVTSETLDSEKKEITISASVPVGTDNLVTSAKTELDNPVPKRLYPYSIKLSYFRSLKAAEESLAVYRQKGLSPYWVKVHLGDQDIWYRVFAGYFEDIDQAEEMIKTFNLKGALVKQTKFTTLIGTYRSESDVDSRIQQILNKGFSPYVIKGVNGEFQLYVGAFYTRKGAQDQYADLLAAGIKSKVVER